MIPALKRQRQVDLFEFEYNLVFRGSSRTARATQNPLLEMTNKQREMLQSPDTALW